MRAFGELWDEITRERYGVAEPEVPAVPLRRAGQLARPHRGAAREQRVAHPDRGARRDAVAATRAAARSSCRPGTRRSPCRGRGTSSGRCGCSRSSRTRPTCSSTPTCSTARRWSRRRSRRSKAAATPRSRRSTRWAARIAAIESGYMKAALVRSQAERMARINARRRSWSSGATGGPTACRRRSSAATTAACSASTRSRPRETLEMLRATTSRRGSRGGEVDARSAQLRDDAARAQNLMPASIACALARVTTGEWAGALREVFGEYRPADRRRGPAARARERPRRRGARARRGAGPRRTATRPAHRRRQARPRRPLERRRDDRGRREHAGFDVIYAGIRLSAAEIVQSAVEEDASVVGLSVLSGSHLELARMVLDELARGRRATPSRWCSAASCPSGRRAAAPALGVRRSSRRATST